MKKKDASDKDLELFLTTTGIDCFDDESASHEDPAVLARLRKSLHEDFVLDEDIGAPDTSFVRKAYYTCVQDKKEVFAKKGKLLSTSTSPAAYLDGPAPTGTLGAEPFLSSSTSPPAEDLDGPADPRPNTCAPLLNGPEDEDKVIANFCRWGLVYEDKKTGVSKIEPPISMHLFVLAANVRRVNLAVSEEKGKFTNFKPITVSGHAGETNYCERASLSHLATSFLLSSFVSHGVDLMFSKPAQYLFYLTQIPLMITPISNLNLFFADPSRHPMAMFFELGLHVILGTDDAAVFPEFDHVESALEREYICAINPSCEAEPPNVPPNSPDLAAQFPPNHKVFHVLADGGCGLQEIAHRSIAEFNRANPNAVREDKPGSWLQKRLGFRQQRWRCATAFVLGGDCAAEEAPTEEEVIATAKQTLEEYDQAPGDGLGKKALMDFQEKVACPKCKMLRIVSCCSWVIFFASESISLSSDTTGL